MPNRTVADPCAPESRDSAPKDDFADIPLAAPAAKEDVEIVDLAFVDDSGRGPSYCNAKVMGGCLRYQREKSEVTNIFPGLNRL